MQIKNKDKKNFLNHIYKLNSKDEIKNFIYYLYKEYEYTYTNIKTIFSNRISVEKVIKILEEFDIKRCSSKDNCISDNGPFLSRLEFYRSSSGKDGLNSRCIKCEKYAVNRKIVNYTKKEQMDKFLRLNSLEERQKYIEYLYKNFDYNYFDLSTITLLDFNQVLQYLNVKKCTSGKYCQDKDGPILYRSKFYNNYHASDNKREICKKCVDYFHKHDENFKEYCRNYYYNNYEHRREIGKQYHYQYAKYETYFDEIRIYHDVQRDPNNNNLLQVKCKLCNQWFNPLNFQVRSRLRAINGKANSDGTEYHFYCSDECKNNCPLYSRKSSELINLTDNQRINSKELRNFVIDYFGEPKSCYLCEREFNIDDLILHHIEPFAITYIFEADINNLIFVCQECHNELHQKDGCKLNQLKEFINC